MPGNALFNFFFVMKYAILDNTGLSIIDILLLEYVSKKCTSLSFSYERFKVYICMYAYVYVCARAYVCVCICVCILICVCVCIYIYIYIYILHIHIHIHIHIHTYIMKTKKLYFANIYKNKKYEICDLTLISFKFLINVIFIIYIYCSSVFQYNLSIVSKFSIQGH